jgi:hypothetical protein
MPSNKKEMEGVHAKTHQDCNRHNNDGLVRSDVLANDFGRDGEGCCRGCRSIETRVRHRLSSTPTNPETCTALVRIREPGLRGEGGPFLILRWACWECRCRPPSRPRHHSSLPPVARGRCAPATDKVSPIDEAQSFQKCLNLSGANAV